MSTTPTSPTNRDNDLDFGSTLRGLRAGWKMFRHYTLVRELGRGGMGVVWLARDEKLELEVALKFLPEKLAHDEAAIDELRRETRRCIKLNHPHIVRVYGLLGGEEEDTTAAIAMEYVEGKSLTGLRLEKENRVFETAEISGWIRQVCEALDYAHREGRLVHRDLKPANLMLDGRGNVRVMDFGIASSLSDSMSKHSRVSQGGASSSGGGTLPYMSPQQLMGLPPSVGDDVYSLGATIYELLTGKPPFFRGGEAGIFRQIETQVPPSMAERRSELGVEQTAAIPDAWEAVVAACLDKEAEKRPRSVAEVWQRLSGTAGSTGQAVKPAPSVAAEKPPERKPAPSLISDRSSQIPHPASSTTRSRKPVLLALAALVCVGGALGWWYGYEQPRQERERLTQVKAAAEEQARQNKERLVQAATESPEGAGKEAPFMNSLGMLFVPVPGTQVLMCVHETRNADYAAYAAAQSGVYEEWKQEAGSGKEQHPVVNVSYEDAEGFCRWLSAKERKNYRLPTDVEWSAAVGLGNETGRTPEEKDENGPENEFPWGSYFPPKAGDGNYNPREVDDGYEQTAPVMSFRANRLGLYDLGGNVYEWCQDWYDDSRLYRVLRGASWLYNTVTYLRSSFRGNGGPRYRYDYGGFRCVLVVAGG
jgi:serine/threonine protein kinase